MAKKKSRKSRTSLGVQGSPAKTRTSFGMQRLLNQQAAWLKGKNVVLTVPGVDPSRRMQKMPATAYWGQPPMYRNKKV